MRGVTERNDSSNDARFSATSREYAFVDEWDVAAPMEAVHRDNRMVVAYMQNDLGGAWSRDNFGNYEFPCEPDGERQRELSFRIGVNLVMYALCLDYKTDQVHVPFIMRRRRWKPDDGAVPTK